MYDFLANRQTSTSRDTPKVHGSDSMQDQALFLSKIMTEEMLHPFPRHWIRRHRNSSTSPFVRPSVLVWSLSAVDHWSLAWKRSRLLKTFSFSIGSWYGNRLVRFYLYQLCRYGCYLHRAFHISQDFLRPNFDNIMCPRPRGVRRICLSVVVWYGWYHSLPARCFERHLTKESIGLDLLPA